MTTVTSYRLYCSECDGETVIKERNIDDSQWSIKNLHHHEGLCPECNPAVDVDLSDAAESDAEPEEIELLSLDHIGRKAAQNLRRAGYDTVEAIADASDDELLAVDWVGEKALFSLKEAAKQHPPQQRWDE